MGETNRNRYDIDIDVSCGDLVNEQLLTLALAIPLETLNAKNIRIHLLINDFWSCPDGNILDGFCWPDPIVFGSHRTHTALSGRTADSVKNAFEIIDRENGAVRRRGRR